MTWCGTDERPVAVTDLPDSELNAFLLTTTEAVDLARAGEIDDGYRCLRGDLARAEECAEFEPWGPELVKRYRDGIARFEQQYGADRMRN